MSGRLIVNADDLGVTRGANLGILRAHREGIVTSASLAVTTPFYRHAVESCVRTSPDLGIGLHFTLTSGRPASSPGEVPLLVDERGFLRWRFTPLLAAALGPRRAELLDQVAIELEAQMQRLLADGIQPDHVDGERHVHLIPGIFELAVAAARRHGVPFVRAGRDIGGRFLRPSHALGLAVRGGFVKRALIERLSARGRRRLDGGGHVPEVASYLYSGRLDLLLGRLLASSPASEVVEIMVHPGIPEESREVELGNRELERYVASPERRLELVACVEARQSLGEWRLTNFRRLAEDGSGAATGAAAG